MMKVLIFFGGAIFGACLMLFAEFYYAYKTKKKISEPEYTKTSATNSLIKEDGSKQCSHEAVESATIRQQDSPPFTSTKQSLYWN
jgi:hypothetical protein